MSLVIKCNGFAVAIPVTLVPPSERLMPGTLHIFRLKADPLQYQVNYNIGANSYVQVFDDGRS